MNVKLSTSSSWFYVLSYECTHECPHDLADLLIETDVAVQ